jgi:hypothetical protein
MIDNNYTKNLLPRPFVESKIQPFIGRPLIKVISGIRRAGKSSILKRLLLSTAEIQKERTLYINMESLENEQFKNVQILYRHVKELVQKAGRPISLYIDEIQEIPGWERAINSFLADGEADIYVSGSNARLLSGELATLLSGRFVEIPVYTLGYQEFLQFRGMHASEDAFEEFLLYGGFPGIHHIEFQGEPIYQYLSALIDSILFKDVVVRYGIRDVALLRSLLLYILDNCGNVFSARSIADYLKKERRSLGIETIYNYLSYLESAYVVYRVPRCDIKGKRILETYEKYYIADIGIRNSLLGFKLSDISGILENIVYLELLRRGFKVFIGKINNWEVDFIAVPQGASHDREVLKGPLYIQVAYMITDTAVHDREFRPLQLIPNNYRKYVLSMDKLPPSNEDGIIRMYLPDFLCIGDL